MNIVNTDNCYVTCDWETTARSYVCDLFNMSRGASEEDVTSRCSDIWDYDMDLFIALMFYMRCVRKNPVSWLKSDDINPIPNGRGEKLLSYWMALWLLNNHELAFTRNFTRFVRDIGYYKDCLIMAKMAHRMKYSEHKIMLILAPMVCALVDDENTILISHINNLPREKLILSMASKWAPRQGKSYSVLIPYMKKLCNITGPKSDAKWRKYIQSIVRATTTDTIEHLLSAKKYDMINFKSVPSKAFNLYKNAFFNTPALSDRFVAFLAGVRSDVEPISMNIYNKSKMMGEFKPNIINAYSETGVLDPSIITFQILNTYRQLVCSE